MHRMRVDPKGKDPRHAYQEKVENFRAHAPRPGERRISLLEYTPHSGTNSSAQEAQKNT